MKSLAVNHDFDDKQGDQINWEDHIGLCYEVARVICSMTEELRPYYMDIVETLKGKLWELAQPKENGGYDSSKGRFATYAMPSLLRYHKQIKQLYLPTLMGGKAAERRATTHLAEHPALMMNAGQKAPDMGREIDLSEIIDDVLSCVNDGAAEFMRAWMPTGQTQREACVDLGRAKNYRIGARQDVRNHIRWLKKNDIELYNQYIDAIGGVPA